MHRLRSMRRSRQAGFTLVELMVIVAIIAILMAMAAPLFERTVASSRLTSKTNDVVLALKMARSEASRTGVPMAVRSVAGSAVFSGGWQVYPNAAGDGAEKEDDVDYLHVTEAAPGLVSVNRVTFDGTTYTDWSGANGESLVFNARGRTTLSYFRICSGLSGAPGRVVVVTAVGKVSVVSNGVSCS